MIPSALRLLGILGGLGGIAVLLHARRDRLLTRFELAALVGLAAVVLVGVHPDAAGWLTRLTGFTEGLSRITSVLAFAVLALVAAVVLLEAELVATRAELYRLARGVAVDAVPPAEPFEVAVVMPAFNEVKNLPEVLDAAPREIQGRRVRVLLVDDGSEDGTAEVARAHGALVVRSPINAGGGHALLAGFWAARRVRARYVATMDADGQHRFEDLPAVLAPLFRGEADLVVGSRNLGVSVGHERFRAVGLRVYNAVLSFLTGRRVTDCSSGFRAFDVACLDRVRLVQQRHHTAELLIEASRRGLRVAEVPITILPRAHGESKKGTNLLYGYRFGMTILSSWWRR